MQIHGVLIELRELVKKTKDSQRKKFLGPLIKQLEKHSNNPDFSYDEHLHALMNEHYKLQHDKYDRKENIEIENKFRERIKNQFSIEGEHKLSLYTVENAIYDELTKTPAREKEYIKALKNVLEAIKLIEGHIIQDKTDTTNHFFILNYYRIRYDCEIILPINQMYDKFLPEEVGDCHGYVLEWARCLLLGLPPFGVRLDQPMPFPLVNSVYPDLNHLARISENIYLLQQDQSSTKKMLEKLAAISSKEGKRYEFSTKQLIDECPFYHSLANSLLQIAKQYPGQAFKISLKSAKKGESGHAIGFHMNSNGEILFIDSNSAWYKFGGKNCQDNFKAWLGDYFARTYPIGTFDKYGIRAYGLNNKLQNKQHVNAVVNNQTANRLASLNLVTSKAVRQTSHMAASSQAKQVTEEIMSHILHMIDRTYRMVINFASGKQIEIQFRKEIEDYLSHTSYATFFLKFDKCEPLKIYEKESVGTFEKLLLFNLERVCNNDTILSHKIEPYTKEHHQQAMAKLGSEQPQVSQDKIPTHLEMVETNTYENKNVINDFKKTALEGNEIAIDCLAHIVESYETSDLEMRYAKESIELALSALIYLAENSEYKAEVKDALEKIQVSSGLDWIRSTVDKFLSEHCGNDTQLKN